MKFKEIKNLEERTILISMIVDPSVLSKIAGKWGKRGNLFRSEWSNLVAEWSVDFYRKFDKAPRKAIQSYFQRWSRKNPDKDTAALVEKFLVGLSSDYKALRRESNAEYVIDMASRYFNQVRLERHQREVSELMELGEIDKALKKQESFARLDLGQGAVVKVLNDKASLKAAFAETKESLIQYPGALGKFLSPYLQRDSFISFLGPEKRGKSFWLLDLAWRATEQRRKTVLIIVGDMSEGQVQMRIGTRVAAIPLNHHRPVAIPVDLRKARTKNGIALVQHKMRKYKRSLSWQRAWRAYQRALKLKVRSRESYLRLIVVPAGGISVRGIDDTLETWAQEGWIADVGVIDYADNLDMEEGGPDPRHQNNFSWKGMRALSQRRHMLIATATQASANSYGDEVRVITRKHFSEDKRKLAHVTGMIGLNQNSEEKKKQLYRLNWVANRDGDYSEYKCVNVAACLALANPCVLSSF